MKCLFHFGITSMKEATCGQLSDRGKLHEGAEVLILVTLKRVISKE